METLLEQQRRYHEERERMMEAMTSEMLHNTKTVRILILPHARSKNLPAYRVVSVSDLNRPVVNVQIYLYQARFDFEQNFLPQTEP